MSFHVSFQIALKGEFLPAKNAFVWFISRMKQNVVFQVRLLAESPVANLALEGPGPVMDVHVAAKITRCWEGLGAQGTFMGLLLVMRHSVVVEI